MSMTPPEDYWFARRFPLSDPRNAVAPVRREGFWVAGGFAGAMGLAALGFLAFALLDLFVAGVIFFIGVSAVAGVAFVAVANAKGDQSRTVADYRNTNVER